MKRNKVWRGALLLTALFFLCLLQGCRGTDRGAVPTGGTAASDEAGGKAGERRETELPPSGKHGQSFTLLLYMIGSDLESEDGAASNDIAEILAAETEKPLRILIETGGAKSWKDPRIGDHAGRRFLVEKNELTELENLGECNMSEGETLSDFIAFARESYPSERYALILWNHGAGTLMGYGHDENYPERMMPLSELRQALAAGGLRFDFVGFDACLMSTLETAAALSENADYMIASEETEPCSGWKYTGFLQALSHDTGLSAERLGRKIVDDFTDESEANYWDFNTLALIRLADVKNVVGLLQDILEEEAEQIETEYVEIVQHAAKTKSFGEGQYEQIDLLDYLDRFPEETSGRKELEQAVETAIVYSRSLVENSCGLAFYYPYRRPESYDRVRDMLCEIGYPSEYFLFFNRFMNTMITGQQYVTGQMGVESDGRYEGSDWYRPKDVYIPEETVLDQRILQVERQSDGRYVLNLTREQWGLIVDIELDCFVETGGGYLDMGSDVRYRMNEDGDLLIDFDGRWRALDGQLAAYYYTYEQREGEWYRYGYIPAVLNGDTQVELMLLEDEERPGGWIPGYRRTGDRVQADERESALGVPTKGLRQLEDGDALRFYAILTDESGGCLGARYLSEETLLWNGNFQPGYISISEALGREDGEMNILLQFKLTDIYGVSYYVPVEMNVTSLP